MALQEPNTTERILPSERCCLADDYVCQCPTSARQNGANNLIIVKRSQVCDGKTDCPLGDDEECTKCEHRKYTQHVSMLNNYISSSKGISWIFIKLTISHAADINTITQNNAL